MRKPERKLYSFHAKRLSNTIIHWSFQEYGFDVDAIDGFGLDALQNVGLPETGDLVVTRGGEPHIVTEWGKIFTLYYHIFIQLMRFNYLKLTLI